MDTDNAKHPSQTVLIVDDDSTTRLFANSYLSKAGYTIVEADDGREALQLVREHTPDIIVLDVDMPTLNGFDTCTQLREMPQFEAVPILMATGLDDIESIDRAYAVGATDFITKPINWPLLLHRIRYMLRAARTVIELAAAKSSLIDAQRIAHMGSWEWQLERDEFVWSEELYRLLGFEPFTVQPTLATLCDQVHPDDRERVRACIEETRASGTSAEIDFRVVLPQAIERHLHQHVEAVVDESRRSRSVQATLQDITESHRAAERIRQLAYSDSLTSLPNREALKERLSQAVALAQRHSRSAAVLFMDLDNFKRVNDTLGHSVGDLLLKAVADRLVTGVRASDAVAYESLDPSDGPVARLGGDEFTILLSEMSDGEEAANVAQRILGELEEPVNVAGHEVFITPSIGISLYPDDGSDAEALLKCADTAMYAAKSAGKNQYRFFDESMNEAALQRLKLDSLLRKALERDEFYLQYQPQLNLMDGSINGVEVLLRWRNAELGMVSPAEFIPLAEDNGTIVPIGEWVLRTACAQTRQWIEDGVPLSRVAVNISVVQFVRPDFPELITEILASTGLAPDALELEITESLLAKDVDGAVGTLRALKDIGVALSIDDFGTGYSSLSQLKAFPIDRLKIDRSFVRDITTDPDDAAIALAVIRMAATMNLTVVAEGVETEAQMRFLQASRCGEMQGYHLSPPLSVEEVVPLLSRHVSGQWAHMGRSQNEKALLIVDDDPATLTAMTSLLECESYAIVTAANANNALDVMAAQAIDVVVADYRMPGMHGDEFLGRVRSLYPDVVRIMVSGVCDMKLLVDALNSGKLFRFIEKPLVLQQVRDALRDAFALRDKCRPSTDTPRVADTSA